MDILGAVYVADYKNGGVYYCSPVSAPCTPQMLTIDGEGPPVYGFVSPTGVAVDGQGNLFVIEGGGLFEWTPWTPTCSTCSTFTSAWGTSAFKTLVSNLIIHCGICTPPPPPFDNPLGVAVDRFGNVYIADTGQSAIKRYTAGYVMFSATAANEPSTAGNDSITFQVLPANSALSIGNVTSDQSWLTITGVTNNTIGFSFTANTFSTTSRTATITVFGGGYLTVTQALGEVLPAMETPAPGATLISNAVTFQWSAGSATQFALWIGTAGVGSGNLIETGGTATSYIATGLPANGSTLYVRLWYEFEGVWASIDYTYTAYTSNAGLLISPPPGSRLTSTTVTFQWTKGSATQYSLWLGTTGPRSGDVLEAGTSATSYTASGLPSNGQTLYATLWSLVNGNLQPNDYTYRAYTAVGAIMEQPVPGSLILSSSATFQWTSGGATQYGLSIGTTGVGSSDVLQAAPTTTLYTVTGLPVNGETLYVRLLSLVNGTWQSNDYTYIVFGGVNLGAACEIKNTGSVTVSDVQQMVDEALGIMPPAHDLSGQGRVNIGDVQIVVNASLGLGCIGP